MSRVHHGMTRQFIPPIAARSSRVHRTVVPFEDRTGLVRMDRNEDVIGWEEHRLQEVLRQIDPTDLAAYHDADHVQAQIAQWLNVDPENVSITAGSSEAVQLVFETYLDEGGVAVALHPSYGLYDVFAAKCGGEIKSISFDDKLQIDVEAIAETIRGHSPSLVVIANPNQPTGSVLEIDDLRLLAEESMAVGAVLLVDEAYSLFTPITALPLVDEFANVVVTQTFSKAMGLAGLRFGYCVGDSARIVEINKLRPLTQSNSLALVIAEYVLDNLDWALGRVAKVIEGREYLIARFREMGFVTFDSYTNFVLLECASLQDAQELVNAIRGRGFAIRGPLRGYPVDNFVRVTVAAPAIMQRFLAQNEESLRMHAKTFR